jgi:hypothetical protein
VNKASFHPDGFRENLYELNNDGTVIAPIQRTSLLKEDLRYAEVTEFAENHLDRVIQIQSCAKQYLARLQLKKLVKNSRTYEQHHKYFSSAEYFETTS